MTIYKGVSRVVNILAYRESWFHNIRGDALSGILVALALIPEAIAFSIIAGVDPMVGLYASFCIAVIIAFVGGRPGMISAATGAMALLMLPLVRSEERRVGKECRCRWWRDDWRMCEAGDDV